MKKKLIISALGIIIFILFVVSGNIVYRIHLMQEMNPEGQYFDANGVKIHYTVKGQGTPIILVHGLAVNAGMNFGARGLPAELARTHQVITLDNRGHGRSDKPHESDAYGTEMCEDIIRLMDHLDIEKAHVLGYSMGGFIVLKLATLHPDRLLSFIICASGWTSTPETEYQFAEDMATTLEQGGNYRALSEKLTPIGKEVSWKNRMIVSYGLKFLNDNKAIAAVLRSLSALFVEEQALKENRLSALAVVGDCDPFRPYAKEMAEVTANMDIVIVDDADHMSLLRRDQARTAIKEHLKE